MNDKEKLAEVKEILIEISEGRGVFSMEPLEHCSNTVDSMKKLAEKALKIIKGATE